MPYPTSGSVATEITKSITQNNHLFTVGQWVYLNGSTYTLTDADASASTDSVGVVTAVIDADNFTVTTEGYASGLSGFTAGTRYYIDGTTAGGITSTAPSVNSKAVFIADSTTSGWVQQGGAPTSGTTVDYAYAEAVASQSLSAINTVVAFSTNTQGNIPNSSGTFTLTAGKTYELDAMLATSPNTAMTYYQWFDVTNSIYLGSVGSTGNLVDLPSVGRSAQAIYTPSTNVTVRVQTTTAGTASPETSTNVGDTNGSRQSSRAIIKQLGSSNIIVPGTDGIWSSYTPTFTPTSGAGAKCNSTYDLASYTTVGKTLHLTYRFRSAGTGGGTSSTGTGVFSLPPGIQFDLTKIVADTQTAYGTPLIGSVIGVGNGVTSAANTFSQGQAYAFSATQFGLQTISQGANNSAKWGSQFDFGTGVSQLGANANNGFSITLTAPIL